MLKKTAKLWRKNTFLSVIAYLFDSLTVLINPQLCLMVVSGEFMALTPHIIVRFIADIWVFSLKPNHSLSATNTVYLLGCLDMTPGINSLTRYFVCVHGRRGKWRACVCLGHLLCVCLFSCSPTASAAK